jgi:hypothetical protein
VSPQVKRNADASRLFDRIHAACPELDAESLRAELNTVLLTERRLMLREIEARLPQTTITHAGLRGTPHQALDSSKVRDIVTRASHRTGIEAAQ